ncbi:MAG: PAS domain S-box protein [Deltaproteobacteria bacterium]|nr:PAS domain S-box protein [Deltaproteobacteria bacterium]
MAEIVILEDDSVSAAILRSILEERGYKVVWAKLVAEFMKLVKSGYRDLAICDISISENDDGIEAAFWAHQTYGVPIIFLTGDNSQETFIKASIANPQGYLTKPFIKTQVLFSVELRLKNSALLKKYRSINQSLSDKITILHALSEISRLFGSFSIPFETRIKSVISLTLDVFNKKTSSRIVFEYSDSVFSMGDESIEHLVFEKEFTLFLKKAASFRIYFQYPDYFDHDFNEFSNIITERIIELIKQSDTSRRLEIFEKAIEQSPVAIVLTSAMGDIEFINRNFTQVTGFSEEEALGKKPSILKSGYHDDAFYRTMWQSLLFGRMWKGEIYNRRKDGSCYWEETTIFPIRTKGGFITHMLAFKQDITERMENDRKLRESENLLRKIMEVLKVGFMKIDVNTHKIAEINSVVSDIYGISPENPDICCEDVFCDSNADSVNMCKNLKKGEVILNVEKLIEKKDGQYITVLKTLLTQNINDKDYIIEILVDITERIALERNLSHAQKMESIGQLAAGIAHEINTPSQYVGDNIKFFADSFNDMKQLIDDMSSLIINSYEASEEGDKTRKIEKIFSEYDWDFLLEEVPSAISDAASGIERISHIVRAMKNFSHPGQEEKTLSNINEGIENTVTVCRNEWKYVADMELDLDQSSPLVPCHLGELNQVFLNMIINAAHAIEEKGGGQNDKGKIKISTSYTDNWFIVKISDSGSGIKSENLNKIFDPFFTTKAVGKGTGQGLSIAYQLVVEKHSGHIDVESDLGKGTTFIIKLPVEEV